MNRAAALTYLSETFATIASDLSVTATDDAAGYKTPIDAALRLIGTAEGDIATADITSDVTGYLAALDYTALLRFQRMYATRVDISIGEPAVDKKRSQSFKNLAELLAQAKDAAIAAGVLDTANGWTVGRLNLDFLEPSLDERE